MDKIRRVVIAGLVAAITLSAAPAAFAKGGVTTSGTCTGPSSWKLGLRPEDGGLLRATLEVQGGAEAQTWKIVFKDNGTVFGRGKRVSGVDGAFRIRRTATDQPGTDAVQATATNLVTGEVCAASATI